MKLFSLLLLMLVPLSLSAATLSWSAYQDDVANFVATDYEILAECTRTTDEWVDAGKVTADKNSLTVALLGGETGVCRIRARRISDDTFSAYSAEVAYTIPLEIPAIPTGLTIFFD
jgi:hypothetical protein